MNRNRLIAVQNGHTVINIFNRKWSKKSPFETVQIVPFATVTWVVNLRCVMIQIMAAKGTTDQSNEPKPVAVKINQFQLNTT